MYQFKAVIMCDSCGDIHAEKWLKSNNRHATQTVLFTPCEPCVQNELKKQDVDPFALYYCQTCESNECKGHPVEADDYDLPETYTYDFEDTYCNECGEYAGVHMMWCINHFSRQKQ